MKKPALKDFFCLLLLIGIFAYCHFTRPRYAFVQSDTLINGYLGMKEARQAYTDKRQQWQANLDTLRADLIRKKSDKATPAAVIEQLEKNAGNYAQTLSQLAQEEDAKMTQAVLDQINSYVEQYGKEHGYDLILGTAESGNILYGSPARDITEELLEELNKEYNPAAHEAK